MLRYTLTRNQNMRFLVLELFCGEKMKSAKKIEEIEKMFNEITDEFLRLHRRIQLILKNLKNED